MYRKREKIQNDLDINTMWFDLLLKTDVPSYHEYMDDWVPPLRSFSGSKMSIDSLASSDGLGHIDWSNGSSYNLSLSQRTQPYVLHETFLRFGSLALVGSSGVHYDYDGSYLGFSYRLSLVTRILREGEWVEKILWSRTLATENNITHPVSSLSEGTHRITVGVLNPTSHSITLKISIDGGNAETVNFVVSQNESLETYNHDIYSTVALSGNTVFSNFSVFFNQPYPSNQWLSSSHKTLTRPYQGLIAEDISVLNGMEPSGFPSIEALPGSLINTLESILFLGTNHRLATKVVPLVGNGNLTARVTPSVPGIAVGSTVKINQNQQSPFSGCWTNISPNAVDRVTLRPATETDIPASVTFGADYSCFYRFTNKEFKISLTTKTIHHFRLGDSVVVRNSTNVDQGHTWVVTAVDDDGFSVVAQNISSEYNFVDECLIKQTPIGGGAWIETYTEGAVGLGYRNLEAYQKNILIDDRKPYYAEVRLAEIDNTLPSKKLYIPKNLKSVFNHEQDRFPAKAVGDCHRLYLFLPVKQNTVSHTSVIVFGEVFDWFKQDWCSIAMVSIRHEKEQDTGYNYAFLYPDWSIDQETGFLICRSFKSHASDGSLKINENGVVISLFGYGDSGQHVYPINVPYVSFVP